MRIIIEAADDVDSGRLATAAPTAQVVRRASRKVSQVTIDWVAGEDGEKAMTDALRACVESRVVAAPRRAR